MALQGAQGHLIPLLSLRSPLQGTRQAEDVLVYLVYLEAAVQVLL